MMWLAATSTEDLAIPCTGDATGLPVQVAFVPVAERREPASDEYHTAAWAVDDGQDVIVITVGPGSAVVLEAGQYVVWARVTSAAPRKPVRRSGSLTVGV
ncbi:hypothetical protein [Sphaerisporangium sp. NPDC051011]|uniref:hypothetical protein n=1 Tax=Sphaerisporangium sp. NPDC051011 TaxID=3155792 RepID=UPI0033DBB80B